jgi:hypothetical protein
MGSIKTGLFSAKQTSLRVVEHRKPPFLLPQLTKALIFLGFLLDSDENCEPLLRIIFLNVYKTICKIIEKIISKCHY